MNISPVFSSYSNLQKVAIKNHTTPSFRGSSWYDMDNNFYDDDDSILSRLDNKYQKLEVDNNWKEIAHKQEKLTKINHKVNIPNEKIANSNIAAFRQIGANNVYSASMRDTAKNMNEIKDLGIKHVISLCRPEETTIQKACQDNKMDFHRFYVPELTEFSDLGKLYKIDQKRQGSFVDIVKTLKKGNAVIGCESGNQRTGMFIGILSMLDPKSKFKVSEDELPKECKIFGAMIYKGLKKEEKALLGYTESFNKKVAKTLESYLKMI